VAGQDRPLQIDQILANLCVNARDAIAGVGKITIETGNVVFDEATAPTMPGFVPGEYVMLAVSDNGCGMDRETLDIFRAVFHHQGGGQGHRPGLATVYGIVKQNDGFINVYSEPGQGTTFKIYLPRHDGEIELRGLADGRRRSPAGRDHPAGGGRAGDPEDWPK
jgi:signal transduction histidine kinase